MYSASHHRPTNVASRPSHRARSGSSSDPFQDPLYTTPHIAYNSSPQPQPPSSTRDRDRERPPPPVPAKSKHQYAPHPRQRSVPQYTDRAPRMEVAARDPVKIEPRAKVSRSQTGGLQSVSVKPVAPSTRRSYSQDSATAGMKPSNRMKSSKKNSAHADVIDRLDFTGVGPTVVFHHDGPFDACAPSRNRHKSKAPMMAWSAPVDEDPVSAAELRQDRQKALGSSPYDAAAAYDDRYGGYITRDNKQVDRIAEAWGIHEPEPYEEFFGGGGGGGAAAGDTSAASSIRGGYEAHTQNSNANANANGTRTRHQLRETYTTESPPVRKATSRVPPPVPLNLPGGSRGGSLDASMPSPPLSGSPGAPKRSKSLMQKIRRMRDQPNIPADAAVAVAPTATAYYAADGNPSPPSSSSENYPALGNDGVVSDGGGGGGARTGRPTHRSQNSFFGRLAARQTSANPGLGSPLSDVDNHYVYVEKHAGKALPPRPMDNTPAAAAAAGGNGGNERDGYFDNSSAPGPGTSGIGIGIPSSPNGNGVGVARKTSILRKVKGAVRGGR